MSFWLLLVLAAPSLYGLLLLVVPRGHLLHEVIWLPVLWYRLLSASSRGMKEQSRSYGQHARQYLLSFRPEVPEPQPLTVIYFHGGGWRLGAPEHFRANARVLAGQGYHVLIPSYRRLPHHDYQAIREDLAAIRRLIPAILREEGREGNALVIGGMSAGGHLAAMLALDPGLQQPLLPLRGLFFLGAPLDLEKMPDSRTLRQLAGPRHEPNFRKANPCNFLSETFDLPTLFIHGEKDALVPVAAARSFAGRLQERSRSEVQFHQLPAGTHLDAVQWAYTDGPQRKLLLAWLQKLEPATGET